MIYSISGRKRARVSCQAPVMMSEDRSPPGECATLIGANRKKGFVLQSDGILFVIAEAKIHRKGQCYSFTQ